MRRLTTLKRKVATIDTRRGSPVAVSRIRGDKLRKIRERIMLRDEYTCQVCGRVTVEGVVDHRQPLHLGGQETDANRQWLCVGCHDLKSAEEEKERGMGMKISMDLSVL